jgi:uncharacterized protein (DUF2147 family)
MGIYLLSDQKSYRPGFYMKKIFLLTLIHTLAFAAHAQGGGDAILGKWISTDNNIEVEVKGSGGIYGATVLWFDDSDNKNKPMATRMDEKNPLPALRSRRIIGLQVLDHLTYKSSGNRWENGEIYDSSSGKTWDASAWVTNDGLLKVRGYWLAEFLGETMKFKRP